MEARNYCCIKNQHLHLSDYKIFRILLEIRSHSIEEADRHIVFHLHRENDQINVSDNCGRGHTIGVSKKVSIFLHRRYYCMGKE